jgi:quinol monooxygenase YgiN
MCRVGIVALSSDVTLAHVAPPPHGVVQTNVRASGAKGENNMIGVVATLKVQPEKASEFEKIFLDLAAKVKANEPGCLMYQLTRSRTEAGIYKVLEVYASDEALQAHGGTDYFKAAGAAMGPTMAGRPEIEYLDGVE